MAAPHTPLQSAYNYQPDAVWPAPAGAEPLAVAVRPDGVSYTVLGPRRIGPNFKSLVRRAADGGVTWERVVLDAAGLEARPLAVAGDGQGTVYLSTDSQLLALSADGTLLWSAPAGDAHPDFGPAARSLILAGSLLYGTDMANARVLGYQSANGNLRLRLGTAGSSPGSYLSPLDVALGARSTLLVADWGNRRIDVIDTTGNPVTQWPLPARPRALATDLAGQVFVALETDEIWILDSQGIPLTRFGTSGRGPGQFQMITDLAVGVQGQLVIADRGNQRVQVWRPMPQGSPGTPSPPAPTPTPRPTPGGGSVRVTACPDQPAHVALPVAIPAAPPKADVMILFDTTGSMESMISTAQARAREILALLQAVTPDVAVGVMDVRDYPYGRAGMATDWAYYLRGPLSTDPLDLEAATADLWAGGGGDAPEAYSGAAIAALDDSNVGWRPGARRFLVLLGDSVPRDDDLNEGVPAPRKVPGVWTPGQPAWWRDSGPDWAPGTADDLDWQAVLARLKAEGVTLFAGISGAAPEALNGSAGELLPYWRAWTAQTGPGGTAVDLTNVGQLPQALSNMLAAAGRHIVRLSGTVDPPLYTGWAQFTPATFSDLDIPPGGLARQFDVLLDPPPGTPDGAFALRLAAVGDGAEYAAVDVELDWRATCERVPTPAPPTAIASPTATLRPSPTSTATPSATATLVPSPTRSPSPTPRTPDVLYVPLVMRGFCPPSSRPRADIVLVIDNSSSMATGGKLQAALTAAGTFVDLISTARDRVGAIAFNDTAALVAGLTSNKAAVKSALGRVAIGEGTRIDRGLDAALDELAGPRARSGTRQVIILLTDGRPDGGTQPAVEASAARARARSVTVFVVGLGADVDGTLLGAIAGDPTRYIVAPDAGALAAIYRRIAEVLPCS